MVNKKIVCFIMSMLLLVGTSTSLAEDTETTGLEYNDGIVSETTENVNLVGKEATAVKEYLEEHSDDVINTNKTLDESINDLADMEILQGFPDGDYHVNENATRAQMAVFINRMRHVSINLDDEAVSNALSGFSDIDSSHWAAKEISNAILNNWISGYDDGTIRPEENVSYLEAVTMILNVLNYNILINESGGYPEGVLTWANTLELFKNTAVGSDYQKAITRGDLIIMISSAFDTRMADTLDENCIRTDKMQVGPLTLRQYLDINNF